MQTILNYFRLCYYHFFPFYFVNTFWCIEPLFGTIIDSLVNYAKAIWISPPLIIIGWVPPLHPLRSLMDYTTLQINIFEKLYDIYMCVFLFFLFALKIRPFGGNRIRAAGVYLWRQRRDSFRFVSLWWLPFTSCVHVRHVYIIFRGPYRANDC